MMYAHKPNQTMSNTTFVFGTHQKEELRVETEKLCIFHEWNPSKRILCVTTKKSKVGTE